MRRAAELAPARPDAVEHARDVARADLPHLDAGAELVREVAYELAKVHAVFAAEIHGHPPLARGHLDVDDLHGEPARARKVLARDDGRLFAAALLTILAGFFIGGESDHPTVESIAPQLGYGPARASHLAERRAARGLDADDVADVQHEVADQLVVVGGGGVAQPHAHEILVR